VKFPSNLNSPEKGIQNPAMLNSQENLYSLLLIFIIF